MPDNGFRARPEPLEVDPWRNPADSPDAGIIEIDRRVYDEAWEQS
jgi:hypothetical protein